MVPGRKGQADARSKVVAMMHLLWAVSVVVYGCACFFASRAVLRGRRPHPTSPKPRPPRRVRLALAVVVLGLIAVGTRFLLGSVAQFEVCFLIIVGSLSAFHVARCVALAVFLGRAGGSGDAS